MNVESSVFILQKKFKEMDTSGDGKVSYEEYMVAMGEVPEHVHRYSLPIDILFKVPNQVLRQICMVTHSIAMIISVDISL